MTEKGIMVSELDGLFRHILGPDTDEDTEIGDLLQDRWDVDYDKLGEIVEALLKLTIPMTHPETGKSIHVSGKPLENGAWRSLVWVMADRQPEGQPEDRVRQEYRNRNAGTQERRNAGRRGKKQTGTG